MKLSTYAKKLGITYRTAFSHYQQGLIMGAYSLPTGTIIVPDEKDKSKPEYLIVYGRVSSSENKDNLDSQVERVLRFCSANGWVVNEVVKECASGLNDSRPKLLKILKDKKQQKL